MTEFSRSERIARPQILAGILLLAFLAQCVWLISHERPPTFELSQADVDRIDEGVAQWRGLGIAGTPALENSWSQLTNVRGGRAESQHSPLWYLIGSAPVAFFHISPESKLWLWFTRAPYVFIGVLLGASLWYVARRLYGNAGGYTALVLYCFSPAAIRSSTLWYSGPHIAAAWGAFGAVFTAIALSHTLYAPREVVLWNWRRILLLGVSLALAVGSQFGLAIILPLLLVVMFYLAPDRRAAAFTILLAACLVAVILIFAGYFFHPRLFWHGLANARWLDVQVRALGMSGAYVQVVRESLAAGPVLALLVPAGVVIYAASRRARYFGNTAPLVFAALCLVLRVAAPHEPDSVYSLLAVIFLIVFIAGTAADLLETKSRELTRTLLTGLLFANAAWNLVGLAQISR